MAKLNATGCGSPSSDNVQPFRLLDLPPELRNKVYACIITNFEYKSMNMRQTKHVVGVFAQLNRLIQRFLMTCKTIWFELLSLLFGSYIWTTDLRFNGRESERLDVIPRDSWLLTPSTLAWPTSGSIRHVKIRFDQKFAHPLRAIHAAFTVETVLMRTAPYFEIEAECRVWFKENNMYYRTKQWEKEMALKKALEESVGSATNRLVKKKAYSNEAVGKLTIDEWHDLVMAVRPAYLEWKREESS